MNGNVNGKKCTQTTCMMKIQHYCILFFLIVQPSHRGFKLKISDHHDNVRFHNIGFPTGCKYSVNGTAAAIPL